MCLTKQYDKLKVKNNTTTTVYRLYDLVKRHVLRPLLNCSTSFAIFKLKGKLFHILGPIDRKDESYTCDNLLIDTGNFSSLVEHSLHPCSDITSSCK